MQKELLVVIYCYVKQPDSFMCLSSPDVYATLELASLDIKFLEARIICFCSYNWRVDIVSFLFSLSGN